MNDMPSTSFEPMKPFVAALVRTNQALVGQFEKWVELRLNSLRAYVDLGLAQTKIALMTTDAQSASEFADSQFAVLSFVGYRMMEDGRALADWGGDCFAQTNRLARENALGLLFKD